MKTTLHQNNFSIRHHSRRSWLVGAAIVFFLVLIFSGPVLNTLLGGTAVTVARPFWVARNYLLAGLEPLTSIFQTKRGLIDENNKLRLELEAGQLVKIDYDVLVRENKELREIIGLSSAETEITVGKVVSHPWNSPYDILLVDLSNNNNQESIKAGDLVTYHETLALGRIEKVVSGIAKVVLFSVGSSKVAAMIGASRIPVILNGRGNGNFVTELPRNLEIVLGSSVLLVEGKRDYTLGLVGAISKTPGETLQTIYVRSPINISQLTYVEIRSR